MQQSTAKRWLQELISGDEARQNDAMAMLPDDPGVLVRLVYENNYFTTKSGGQVSATHIALDAVVVEAIKFIVEKSHFADLVMITKTLQSQEMRKLPWDLHPLQLLSDESYWWKASAKAVSDYWDKVMAEKYRYHLENTPMRKAQIRSVKAEREEFEKKFLAKNFTPAEMIEFGEYVRQAEQKKYVRDCEPADILDRFSSLHRLEQAKRIAQIKYPIPRLDEHKRVFMKMLDHLAERFKPIRKLRNQTHQFKVYNFGLLSQDMTDPSSSICCVTLAQVRRASSRDRS